jgi:hypothetical protein
MNPKNLRLFILFGLVIIFNYFFWAEKLGLNLLIFSLLITGALFFEYKNSFANAKVQFTLLGSLISLAMVLIYNSLISKIAFFASFSLCVVFIHEPQLRSVWYGLAYAVSALFYTFPESFKLLNRPFGQHRLQTSKLKKWLKLAQLTFIPLVVFAVFFGIFRVANPVFLELSDNLFFQIQHFFNNLFLYVSFPRLAFIALGIFLIITILYKWQSLNFILQNELKESEIVIRVREKPIFSFKTLALKSACQTGVILMVMVNGLVLIVNIIDFIWLWIGFDAKKVLSLKSMVYEGTYMLIISILLSMGIMLYYFRSNLNFYQKNSLLKKLAYMWILQNAFLSLSVAMRTYYYIIELGLGHKRIGVLIFLSLTLYGLFSLFMKIKNCKSAFYLLRTNTWAAYVMLILMTLVDWDVLIIRYNLSHYKETGEVSPKYLVNLADKTLPIIYQNPQKVKNAKDKQGEVWYERHKVYVANRAKNYLKNQKTYSWLSWNYADYQTEQYFLKNPIKE